jgi:DNA mismatch endonuclease, patch repair protein
MADVFTKRKRSEVMARIRGRGNKDTEVALAKLLRANGISGWRRHQAVIGKPDFIFRKERVAVFVDGCFWHGCPIHSSPAKWLKKSSMTDASPSSKRRRSGRAFWTQKMASNIARDRFVNRQLRKAGWKVVRIWEHELGRKGSQRAVERIRQAITS